MLDPQPLVVFTTAYDQYALQAFEVNSIDYLLKPVEERHLARALDKIERLRAASCGRRPTGSSVMAQMAGALKETTRRLSGADRIAAWRADPHPGTVQVTHFFAQDKLTYAATEGKNYVVDHTVSELEQKLDPRQFCRIHRSTLLNLAWAQRGGRMVRRAGSGAAQGFEGNRVAGGAGPVGGAEEATGDLRKRQTRRAPAAEG